MGELSSLINIGEKLEAQLELVGISTEQELKRVGSKEAWVRIKQIDPTACIHRLLALEGAIEGVKKSKLPREVKKNLKEFYYNNRPD